MVIDFSSLTAIMGTSAAVSAAISAGSHLFAWAWKKNRESFVQSANDLDETLEKKTGHTFPPEFHAIYDGIVRKIVAGIDYIANPVIFRRVERFLLGVADPTKRAGLLNEFYEYAKGKAKESISEELKAIVNQESQEEAVNAVGKSASLALPAEFLNTRNIPADVKAAVVAVKHETAFPQKLLTTEEITARVTATRAKLIEEITKQSKL